MKILIFGCKCTLGYPGAPGDGGSVYMLALDIRYVERFLNHPSVFIKVGF